MEEGDPALDPHLNPARTNKERLRRLVGRRPYAPWQGRAGFAAITEAWNGAALASKHGSCGSMIVFGGGHNDYFGSDLHAWDLASRRWSRLSDGYISANRTCFGAGAVYPDSTYPDGSPLPPHTYDYVQYDPAGNDFILFKGQLELGPDVKAAAIPHMFNLDSLTWRRGPRHEAAILNSGGWTTWDASRRVVWGHSGDAGGGNALIAFAPDGSNEDGTFGRWRELYPNKLPGLADHNAMQIVPGRDLIVVAVHGANALFSIDPADPGAPLHPVREEGERPRLSPYAALEFAPNLDCLIYYSACDGKDVYGILPPEAGHPEAAWRWVCLTGAGLDPIADAVSVTSYAANASHTFGRFRVASFSGKDVAILIRHVDSPVYAMLLN